MTRNAQQKEDNKAFKARFAIFLKLNIFASQQCGTPRKTFHTTPKSLGLIIVSNTSVNNVSKKTSAKVFSKDKKKSTEYSLSINTYGIAIV
jgi:hypothetical protein